MFRHEVTLNLSSIKDKSTVDRLIKERCGAATITPDLVEESAVNKPEDYNRLKDLDVKSNFRSRLLMHLRSAFESTYEINEAHRLMTTFESLTKAMDDHGAVILGNMIDLTRFQALIDSYTSKLSTDGSQSWIHAYINLGNHPDFIANPQFNDAFIHPLLIALIAYAAGGPIRIVDGRGKDAEPLAVQAQDNMLHIDNTPFRKEFKVILTWERGKPSGPKGQNFVFLPGTHKAVRNCKLSAHGEAWSTEDGSIFITEDTIQQAFDVQKKVLGKSPVVVEATHPDMPLTTVFEAGALVHHRYRTKEKNVPRSCVIVAFHRAEDNPGQFLDEAHLTHLPDENTLLKLMMGKHSDNTEDSFIKALLNHCDSISLKLDEIGSAKTGSRLVSFPERVLDQNELKQWKAAVTAAPTVEDIKIKHAFFHLGEALTHDVLLNMMRYDKHGPLDLILYSDGHEEIRKWARNRIREMPLEKLTSCIDKILSSDSLSQPNTENLLSTSTLYEISVQLIAMMDELTSDEKNSLRLGTQEKIRPMDAFRSLRQLINDLGEAVVRCSSRQSFLSTCLFLFFACDELSLLIEKPSITTDSRYRDLWGQLLQNYLATYILVSKQINFDLAVTSEALEMTRLPLLTNHLGLFNNNVRSTLPEGLQDDDHHLNLVSGM